MLSLVLQLAPISLTTKIDAQWIRPRFELDRFLIE
jgi:hypothetical protein